MKFLLLIIRASLLVVMTQAFVPSHRTGSRTAAKITANGRIPAAALQQQQLSVPVPSALSMSKSRGSADVDGTSEGIFLFVVALLVCTWFFTVPPEFRRSHWCSEEDAAVYSQCMTGKQFASGIKEYYANGGTVFKFDFSIDPKTLEENAELKATIFGEQ